MRAVTLKSRSWKLESIAHPERADGDVVQKLLALFFSIALGVFGRFITVDVRIVASCYPFPVRRARVQQETKHSSRV